MKGLLVKFRNSVVSLLLGRSTIWAGPDVWLKIECFPNGKIRLEILEAPQSNTHPHDHTGD
jgi:hypothetical protein